jgi:hypothetical protein
MPGNRWQIDGEWLVALPTHARLGRVVQGCLALYDKTDRREIVLTAADLHTILCAESPPAPTSPGNPEIPAQSSNIQS